MDGQQALQKWVADYKKKTRKQSGGRISTIELKFSHHNVTRHVQQIMALFLLKIIF